VVSGNSQYHTLALINPSTYAWVPGGSVTLNLAGKSAGAFAYASLAAPVTLAPKTPYLLVSSETYGGDVWYDWNNTVTPTKLAKSFDKLVYWSSSGGWTMSAASNLSFGPLDLIDPPALADEAPQTPAQGGLVAPVSPTSGSRTIQGSVVAIADVVPRPQAMPDSLPLFVSVSSSASTSAGPLSRPLTDETRAGLRLPVADSTSTQSAIYDQEDVGGGSDGQGISDGVFIASRGKFRPDRLNRSRPA
jgi:hypothetical protein